MDPSVDPSVDPTARFFSKLKRLAITLETETEKLQRDFEARKQEDKTDEASSRAWRSYHELKSDVTHLKTLVRDQLVQEEAQNREVKNFIGASRETEKKLAEDVQTLRRRWETYGYQAPRRTSEAKGQEDGGQQGAEDKSDSEKEEGEDDEDEEQEDEDAEAASPSSPPLRAPRPFRDLMQTPQLSDFGLSEMQLKRTLAGVAWSADAPPTPQISLPPACADALATPTPITPKRILRMEDEALRTPPVPDFVLRDDFTDNLVCKYLLRPEQDKAEPTGTSAVESLPTKAEKLATPEPPSLCTPGLKIRNTNGHPSSSAAVGSDPQSPCAADVASSTPELPEFQTPYVKRLVSSKKSSRPPQSVAEGDGLTFDLPSPRTGAESKPSWEYNVPDVSIAAMGGAKELPAMPNLESFFGHSLISKNAKQLKTSESEKTVQDQHQDQDQDQDVELDGATQEFRLSTPRIRTAYEDPSTPEMPDLSSVTQDICKLVSQAQTKKTTVVPPQINNGCSDLRRAPHLADVSEGEFQTLPSYLRQMSLSSLNAAVHSINRFSREHRGEVTELQMEELKRVIAVGTKAPVYILCLAELRRLQKVGELRDAHVYKLVARC
ncbi:unnamed protein product [Ophioblennius macclurei]